MTEFIDPEREFHQEGECTLDQERSRIQIPVKALQVTTWWKEADAQGWKENSLVTLATLNKPGKCMSICAWNNALTTRMEDVKRDIAEGVQEALQEYEAMQRFSAILKIDSQGRFQFDRRLKQYFGVRNYSQTYKFHVSANPNEILFMTPAYHEKGLAELEQFR